MSSTLRVAKSVAGLLGFLFVLALGAPLGRAEQVKNLKPQGYVNDFAGVLSPQAKQKLTALCAEVDQKAKAQIAVVTVSSLEGEPIEQFSIELATQWGVGPKQQARGIMILLAPNDRKYRIEVGYGLEPILPDGKVGGFGREAVPFLQRSDYDGAALLLTQRVASVIAEDQKVTLDTLSGAIPAAEPDTSPLPVSRIVWLVILVVFLFFPIAGLFLRLLFGLKTLREVKKAQTHFRIGKYLVGLDDCNYVTDNVECIVGPTHFVFAELSGQELGRVPRDSIEEVALDDKSQIMQRLTATRMVALGVFALAAPKKRKINEWCVAIRWVDSKGLKRTTVFEFTGSNPEGRANMAASMLMKYVERRPQQPEGINPLQLGVTADSKTCPFCAETIKAAAIVCRFCNRTLSK